VAVQQLDRLDKDTFSDEERQEAARICDERRQEEQLLVSRQPASITQQRSACLVNRHPYS